MMSFPVPMSNSAIFQENLTHTEKVVKIKDIICKLEKAKESLLNDSNQLKKEIEEAVGFQLSNLRLRELQMWRQVDALIGHQNLLIQEELSKLHFLLGSYNVASACVQEGQYIQGLDSVDMLFKSLKPGSLQKLNFKVDHTALQLAIQGFGKLEPQCDSGASGMFLLPAEEDYEDGDHHVLYKSIKDQQFIEAGLRSLLVLSSPTPEVMPMQPMSDSSGSSFEILDDDSNLLQCESHSTPSEELKSCCGCHSTSSIEIENLDEVSCSSNHQTSPASKWLRSSVSCTSNIPPAVLLAKDHALMPQVETACKANEKCATFSNCICDENCMVTNLKEQMGNMEFMDCDKYSPGYLKETVNNIIQKSYNECPPKSCCLSNSKLEKYANDGSIFLKEEKFYDGWLSKDYFKSSSLCSYQNSLSQVSKCEESVQLPEHVLQKQPDVDAERDSWLSPQYPTEGLHKPALTMQEMFLSYLQPIDTSKWLSKK